MNISLVKILGAGKTILTNMITFYELNLKPVFFIFRCIHGGRVQIDREASLADIRNGVVSILIATDVASRGIDIHDISLVINYDFPLNIEEYVHRVGRTGRAGKRGSAITLFSKYDKFNAASLIGILEKSKQPIPPELYKMTSQ